MWFPIFMQEIMAGKYSHTFSLCFRLRFECVSVGHMSRVCLISDQIQHSPYLFSQETSLLFLVISLQGFDEMYVFASDPTYHYKCLICCLQST